MPRPSGLIPAVLREREFRLLWSGQLVSVVGDGMLLVALSFAVLDLTGSVEDVGLALAASRAPLVLTVLAGGVVADRLPRRTVMVGADLVRLGCQAASAALLLGGHARLWQLLVLQAAAGTAAGFFYPAQNGIWPLTMPPELYQQGNALRGVADSGARVVGPALGGLLVVAVGAGWALAADAVSFGVSAASLGLLRLPVHVPPVPQRFLRDLADGWREFRSRTWLWLSVVTAGSIGNFFSAFFPALGPGIAKAHLGGAGAWGTIVALQGLGGLVGGLLVLRLRARRPLSVAHLGWGLFFAPSLALAFVAPTAVIAAATFAVGLGAGVAQALWDTALQRHVPGEALSRVAAYDWFGSLVFNPAGFAAAGFLAGALGSRATLLAAAGWFVVAGSTLASLPSIRALQDRSAPLGTSPPQL